MLRRARLAAHVIREGHDQIVGHDHRYASVGLLVPAGEADASGNVQINQGQVVIEGDIRNVVKGLDYGGGRGEGVYSQKSHEKQSFHVGVAV